MSKHIELAKKIKALCERGIGGEKANAEKMLNDFLKKHNISHEDLEGEETKEYYFKLNTGDFELWHQIVRLANYDIKIYGEFPKKMVKDYSLAGNYMVKCTVAEYVEIESKHAFYKKLYAEELEIFYSAFLRANDLLVDNPNREENKEFTQEEYEEWKRVKGMAERIKKGQYLKQLTQALS